MLPLVIENSRLTGFRWSGTGLSEIGTDPASGKIRVRVNPKFYRPVENESLLGFAAKAKRVLGWEPEYTFERLVEEMVLSDIQLVKTGRIFSTTYLDWLSAETHDGSESEDPRISEFDNSPDAKVRDGLDKVLESA